jgi:hypothetical protein
MPVHHRGERVIVATPREPNQQFGVVRVSILSELAKVVEHGHRGTGHSVQLPTATDLYPLQAMEKTSRHQFFVEKDEIPEKLGTISGSTATSEERDLSANSG